ncbi:hypothetical protein JW964_05585 [candidate division KSB1 bacterium]|nr:hypothetical protein [candidate division KSB1 bacterium]
MQKTTLLLILFLSLLFSEIKANDAFGIKFSGYVKTDLLLDTRQTVAVREGHFLLYPANKILDPNGHDINEGLNTNILAIQTRLKGTITGPEAFGAKTGGVIEAAFFGHSDNDVNGFRLRHAFLTMSWEKTSLMIGQFWHPMFVTEVFPGTVSFNTGAPFQPFSRNPQIRLTYTAGNLNLIAAAISQRDFTSIGPNGGSSQYLRNAGIPNMHLQFQFKTGANVLGAGADWKALNPRLSTSAGFKNDEKVSSVSVLGYAKIGLPNLTWKVEGVLGNNLTDHLMLGGFGAKTMNEVTKQETYIPTGLYSVWTEISTGKVVELGCFAGYTKNTGASEGLLNFYGRGSNIDVIYRVSPRIVWNSGKTQLATELEYTAASYGTPDAKGVVQKGEFVNNVRLLLAAYYFF